MRNILVTCLVGYITAGVVAGQQLKPGLLVRLYDIQLGVPALPELKPGQTPNFVTPVRTLDLWGDGQDLGPFRDRFLTEVVGKIRAETGGQFTFRLISDDGAQLWINGQLVVDHDGLHGPDPKDGTIELSAGWHDLHIWHFENGGGERLALQWHPPTARNDSNFVLIPPEMLAYPQNLSTRTTPGRKEIIPPLRRGLPGAGSPVAGLHPSFTIRARPATDEAAAFFTDVHALGVIEQTDADAMRAVRIWLPPGGSIETKSARQVQDGPYAGQALIACGHAIRRVSIDEAAPTFQGCAFRFAHDADAPPARLRPHDDPTFELLAVHALANGFELVFTKPLDPRVGWWTDSYHVERWPFDPEQGMGPRRDGTRLPVQSASVSKDRRRVFLELDPPPTPCVVYLRLLPPCLSEAAARPWSTEAWYTLWQPSQRHGIVRKPPAQEQPNQLTLAEKQAGWRLLFDGLTTQGWRGYRKETFPDAGWVVRDGCLVRIGPGGDIITASAFEDFELKLEWRISAGGNSGIFYRVDESQGWPWETGPEMQVLDNAEHADGQNPKTSAGACYALYAPQQDVTKPVGLFNQARIIVDGDHVEHWLNGVKIVAYELGSEDWRQRVADSKFSKMPLFGKAPRGHIVLQDHGDTVWYRNIMIRARD